MKKGATLSYIHQDHLTGTAVMSDDGGTQVGTTMKYTPLGLTRSGSVPTDKLFTGQRLDSTGLYYYGARYYDSNIGRFISADIVTTDLSNPQQFNRYTYVLNNPLKHIDPSGRTVIIVGGSGATEAEMQAYYNYLVDNNVINGSEPYVLMPDTDPEIGPGFDVGPRLDTLYDVLSNGCTDVKLLGHSEGAATVAAFLSELANDPVAAAEKMGATKISDIKAAVLLECPTNQKGFEHIPLTLGSSMNNLPGRLIGANLGIRVADVWDKGSLAHGGQAPGWEGYSHPYDSRSLFELRYPFFGFFYKAAKTGSRHEGILRNENANKVIKNTFYYSFPL